jgi:predicted aspartyl protease
VRKVICCFLGACFFLHIDSAHAGQKSDGTIAPAPSEIPFELRGGFLIVIEGRMAELQGLKFILDTGASYSVVDRQVAQKLSFLRHHAGRVFSFDKYVPIEWAECPVVQFGPIEVHDIPLMVANLRNSRGFPGHADVIIGLDLLRTSRGFLIDYERRKIVFGTGTVNHDEVLRPKVPFLVMQVMIQGRVVRLIVDTGMQGVLLYEDRLRKEFPNLGVEVERDKVQNGYLRVKRAKIQGFIVGTAESERTVFLMNGPSENLLPGIDGYLGTGALNAQQVAIDFANNTLAWKE